MQLRPTLFVCALAVLALGCAEPEPDWQQANPTSELDGPNGCGDGVDNDGDGQVDCVDPDCVTVCEADNWPPEVRSVHIEPTDPGTHDVLTCVVDASDQDGDPIAWTIEWWRDGKYEAEGPDLPAEHTVGYDTWTCEATPTDGIAVGVSADASTTIRAEDTCTSMAYDQSGRVVVSPIAGQDLVGTDLTVEAWVWVDPSGSTTLPILDSDPQPDGSGWRFAIVGPAGSRTVKWQQGGGIPGLPELEGIRTVPDGEWSHVAVTVNGQTGEVRAWIDGTPSGSRTLDPLVAGASYGELGIGGSPDGTWQFLGNLDEVRISTVRRYTSDFLPRTWTEPDADTLGLWHLDEGSGVVTADALSGTPALVEGVSWDGLRSACDAR